MIYRSTEFYGQDMSVSTILNRANAQVSDDFKFDDLTGNDKVSKSVILPDGKRRICWLKNGNTVFESLVAEE